MTSNTEDQILKKMSWLDFETGIVSGKALCKPYIEILSFVSRQLGEKYSINNTSCAVENNEIIKIVFLCSNKKYTWNLNQNGSDWLDAKIFLLIDNLMREIPINKSLFFQPSEGQDVLWGLFTDKEIVEISNKTDIKLIKMSENGYFGSK